MDTAQWPQEIVVKPIEEIIVTNSKSDVDQDQNNKRDHHEQEVLKCPRCNSGNTKFCYYNNYSLTQPRFFCKACRRYWTQGGSLRNIPVGGASRKINKIRSSSSSSSKIINNRLPDLVQGQDLNLALTRDDHHTKVNIDGSNNTSFGMNMMINHSFVHPHPLTTASSASFGFSLNDNNNNNYNTQEQDFKPSLDFSLDGISGSGGGKNNNANNGRLLFPFEDYLKGSNGINVIEPSNNNNNNNNSSNNSNIKDQEDFPITGYWTGMLGGGSW